MEQQTTKPSQPHLRNDEMVDHPRHYGGADNPYEHVKVMKAILQNSPMNGYVGGLIYNCTKYLWRLGQKGDALEDAKKAQWYLNELVVYLENNNPRVIPRKDPRLNAPQA